MAIIESKVSEAFNAFKLEMEGTNVKSVVDDLSSDVAHIYEFGIPPVDVILGGGILSGKIYEIFGWESQGKSTFGLEATKAFCKYWRSREDDNYAILWIETESALDKIRATWMGCEIERFLIAEAEHVEEGFDIISQALKKCVAKKMKLFIVWDTIAAAPTKAEKEGGTYAGGMAEKARVIRHCLRNIVTDIGATDSTFIIVNQVYATIGSYIAGVETPGGGGIKFHASARIQLTKKGDIKKIMPNGDEITEGIITELFTVKNKLTLPKQKAQVVINGERGFNKFETVVNHLSKSKCIEVKGAWKYIKLPKMQEDGTIKIIDITFQSSEKLKVISETTHPELEDYMDYLCYKSFIEISSLIKVKVIDKVWGYEEKFFGKRETVLTEEEISVARRLFKEIQIAEDAGIDEGSIELTDAEIEGIGT